jgi:hypothetical protein
VERVASRRDHRWGLVGPALALALLAAGLGGCAALRLPPAPALPPPDPALPIVLVPGATGSELVDGVTGEVLWGSGRALLLPRDLGYRLARPLTAGPESPESPVEAGAVIERIRLGVVRREIYRPFLDHFEALGYRRGELTAPGPDHTLFAFPYDWRQSNARTAHQLVEALERLRVARGGGPLGVALVCQSNAAHICRWVAKYGGASPAQAEAGAAGLPAGLSVARLVLVGASNGGAIRVLRELDRGRSYVPLVGRRFAPEVLFTFPPLYEDLPHDLGSAFVTVDGEVTPLDLYGAATWQRYGWSALAPATSSRMDQRPDLFGSTATRLAHLQEALDQARRVQALLARDSPTFGATRYFAIGASYTETPARAVLVTDRGRWRTLFTGDRALRQRPDLAAMAAAPGDGHATLASQHDLSPQERAALEEDLFTSYGGHFDTILHPATLRAIASFLLAP